MTREDRLYQEKMKKLIEADMLYNEVYALYSELATEANDYIVREYFDPDSMKNLRKKKRVLQELLKGKSYKEVGKDVVDILEKLPDGVDTMIGTEGTYLSGGEQQRVALARAILKNAPIVVLDEATAFADPENEALIQKAFQKLTEGRTVIMIAHRLSTVVGADRIIVLDSGHVAEQGTHAELLENGGLYARMWADYQQAVKWRITADEGRA